MTQTPHELAPKTSAARKVVRDEVGDRAPNPKRHFQSPEMLMKDPSLSDAQKLALLQDWNLELGNRLAAEEEGMSASDPISERKEARLADEATRVKTLLTELSDRVGASG